MCCWAPSCPGAGVLDVMGNEGVVPDGVGDLAGYELGVGTNASLVWTHTDAGVAGRVAVRGRYAYVAGGAEGMMLVDLAPTSPFTFIARANYLTTGNCIDVAVWEDWAFVADAGVGVVVVDTDDVLWSPFSFTIPLVEVSTIPETTVSGVAVEGNWLYVAASEAGLLIYDVGDVLNPVLVGSYTNSGSAQQVVIEGEEAYVVCEGNRLEVIDVSDAQAPVLVGSYTNGGSVVDVDIDGEWVYLANASGSLSVLSVSNVASPVLETNYPVVGGALGVRVVGEWAYVRNGGGGLTVVELEGKAAVAPEVVRPVLDVTGILGQEVVLSVDVEGSPPLGYQWLKGGVVLTNDGRITGVNERLLKLTSLLESDTGQYQLRVTNGQGQVVSSNIVLSPVPEGTPLLQGAFEIGGGFVSGVALEEEYAYAAAGEVGLQVLDVSNPSFPLFRGSLDTEGTALAVEIFNQHAFIADGTNGLKIVSVDNLPDLSVGGSLGTPGTALGLSVVGRYVCVAAGEAGLQIIDAMDPSQPVSVATNDTAGMAHSVRSAGDWVYVADGEAGVQVFNVTNMASPSLAGSYDTAGTAYEVEVIGSRVYVADGTNGLVILDVSDPAIPVLLGRYATAGPVLAVDAVDGLALLAEGVLGLEVVDVSEPTNVVRIALSAVEGEARDVQLQGSTVCVGIGSGGVQMFTLLGVAPQAPQIQSISGEQYLLPGQGVQLEVQATGQAPLSYQWFRDGQMLFESTNFIGVTTDTLQLTGLDLSDSGNYSVRVRSAWNLSTIAWVTVNVVPVGAPVPLAGCNDSTDYLDVEVDGQRAYVASRLGGLKVVDFSSVTNPVFLGSQATMGFAQQVHVEGHLVYVAAWDAGLEIFDVANAGNLVRVGQWDTPGLARGVWVADGLAYVADQVEGVQIIDVGNPSQPFLVSTVPTRGPALDVWVAGGKAYVAASGAGLQIFDVNDSLGVSELGWLDTDGEAEAVEVVGSRVYVSDYDQGLQIVDVNDPSAPLSLGVFASPGDVYQVQATSDLAYVAEGPAGMNAVDASDPGNLVLSVAGYAGDFVHGVAVQGKHALLADRNNGLVVAEFLGAPEVSPQIIKPPQSTNAVTGSNLVLSVSAAGTPPFSYQWHRDGTPLIADGRISGVTEPHLQINSLTNSDTGGYVAVINSPYGVVTSAVANVSLSVTGTVVMAPAFDAHPANQVSPGAAVNFAAQVSGSAPLTLRWYHNGQPVFDGTHYVGATTTSLVVSNIALAQSGTYELRAWNPAGLATSDPATLTYLGPLQSQIDAVTNGSTVVLSNMAYAETLHINKDLTLSGVGAGTTILDGLGVGIPVRISNGATVTISGVTLRNGQGGGVWNEGQLLLQDCQLLDNQGDDGGGALANYNQATLVGCLLSNNVSGNNGGGVYNHTGALLNGRDTSIAANSALDGGGLYNLGNFGLTNCTLSGNVASGPFHLSGSFGSGQGRGGGIYSLGGSGVLENSTLSGNQALVPPLSTGGEGGGIFSAGATLELRSSTVAFNTATTLGGGVYADSFGNVQARNSVLAANRQGDGPSDLQGTLALADFNLIESTNGVGLPMGVTNNLLGMDAQLAALGDNGGTTLTHALRSGSPAIDAGSDSGLLLDQRGVARPFDIPAATDTVSGEDMGSVEYVSTAPQIVPPADQTMHEDQARQVAFWADDAETPDALSFVVTSDDPTLLAGSNIVVQSVGPNHTLTLQPETNQFGTTTVHLFVSDPDGFTNSTTFNLQVNPVNDPPVVTGISNLVGSLDAAHYTVPFTVYDVDGPGPVESITIQATSSDTNLIDSSGITITGAAGARTLTLPHSPDEFGVTMIDLTASDGSAMETYSFMVTVSPAPILLSLEGGLTAGYTLSWEGDGMVQRAPAITGVWRNVSTTSPFTMVIQSGVTSEFFRVINLVPLSRFNLDSSTMMLAWPGQGVLQKGPTPSGPWEALSSISPFEVVIHSAISSEFFRVVSP